MALQDYEVEINGISRTIQLDDEDAKRAGLLGKQDDPAEEEGEKAAGATDNKQVAAPRNKAK